MFLHGPHLGDFAAWLLQIGVAGGSVETSGQLLRGITLTTAYINRIATGVPAYDVHEIFLGAARVLLGDSEHAHERFERMSKMAGISHRYSCIDPAGGFYEFGRCPSVSVMVAPPAISAADPG
jgi:hypothetical protein